MSVDKPGPHTQNLSPQFETLLSGVDAVSFDLFDTLVRRRDLFLPKDLFFLLHRRCAELLSLDGHDFVSARIRSESIARVRARASGLHETSLAEIYQEMARILRRETEELRGVMLEELQCEQDVLVPTEAGKALFDAARSLGKVVLIVTDTYLPGDFVERVVRDHGYGDARKVFVSSAYGKSKLSGSLFDEVLNDLKCAPTKLLHVGDNRLSDVAMPAAKGIRTLLYSDLPHEFKWHHRLNDGPSGSLTMSSMLCRISERWRNRDQGQDRQAVLSNTAIHHLAPLYFGFAAWLVEQIKKGGYRRVYFAARDGAIMKRFFDLVAPAGNLQVDSRYLYISRATLYPSLSFTDRDMGRQVFTHNWNQLTVSEALRRMSLDRRTFDDLLKTYGLPDDAMLMNPITAQKFARFLDAIWPQFVEKAKNDCGLLVDYLRQEMFVSEEPAVLVDIGWHASLQHCLRKLLDHLGIRKRLDGYYVGTFARSADAKAECAHGFLVEADGPRQISELVRSSPSLIELFHTAGHGSVLGYRRDGDRIVPVLNENPVEDAQFRDLIEPIQEQAFEFVSEHLRNVSGWEAFAPQPELLARLALRVVYAPTQKEAELFGRLMIATDLGGRMMSITGAAEWDLKDLKGDRLPDGTLPMWRAGFQALKQVSCA